MGKNLDSSEQLSISGVGAVRSYYQGVSGDSGYLVDAGTKYALPPVIDIRHAVGLFADAGRVYLQNSDYTGKKNGTRLSDVGVGYYANYEYSTGRYLTATVEAVCAVGPMPDTGAHDARAKVLAQIGVTF
jgi:hemolysin activation/secretion protein